MEHLPIRALCLEVDGSLIHASGTAMFPGTPIALEECARAGLSILLLTDQTATIRRALLAAEPGGPTAALLTKLTAVTRQILVYAPLTAILVATWPGLAPEGEQARWDQQAEQVAAALVAGLGVVAPREAILEASADPLWAKPETGLLERAVALLGCAPDEILCVGTTAADREMALAAGAPFLDAERWRQRAAPWPPW